MRFREVEKLLLKDGWFEVNQVDSHHQYKHFVKPGKITVPEHKGKDMNPMLMRSMLKQAGL